MTFAIPSEADGFEVLGALASRYPIKREDRVTEVFTYHDTFDWRLHRAGCRLKSSLQPLGTLAVWTPAGRSEQERFELEAFPEFAWDLPAGPLREQIEPVLEMRRLLPVVELEQTRSVLHIMDDEQKTVVRVVLRSTRASRPGGDAKGTLQVTLDTLPLRGYALEHENLVRVLRDDLGLMFHEQDGFTAALTAIGRDPGDYTSKPQLRLKPASRSDDSMVMILQSLLEVLLANEDGTRRDLDSEFLHDFRVAVRRTRSALTQVREVFDPRAIDHFRKEFAWLGQVTGPTRDLDVYLLKIDDYASALPPEIRPDLGPLRDFLKHRQIHEQQRLVEHLDSGRYRELIQTWPAFLGETPRSGAVNAGRPIRRVASERIWKAWRRVWKKGRVITPATPAQALHRLRIDCKKLRYLLEFFRGLYKSTRVDALIKALKQLQDNLGEFQDLEVQQDKLREFALQMHAKGAATAPTLLAMGELVAGLRRLQADERRRFAERFARFTQPGNRQAFRRLFDPRH